MADDSRSAPRPRAVDPAEIPVLLRELDASGQSLAAFARDRGLASWRLYKAKQRASKRARPHRAATVRQPSFVPVELTDVSCSGEPFELVLSSGHRLRIPADFDEATLRRLMGVLVSC